MQTVLKNIIYQFSYQFIRLLMPLVSIPVASHALGATAIGTYSFYNSIIQYFVLVAMLGTPIYGVSEIAKNKHDYKLLNDTFWSIELLGIISGVILVAIAIVLGTILHFPILYFIQILYVVGAALDISWLFAGLEKFKDITLMNMVMSTISFLLIITVVSATKSLVAYAFALIIANAGGQMALWAFLRKSTIGSYKSANINIGYHLKGTMMFFLAQLGIVLYTNLNKTMLGVFLPEKSIVGVYTNAVLITTTIVTLISVVDTVFLPRMTNLFGIEDSRKKAVKIISNILEVQLSLTIPLAIGLGAIAKGFVPWFFGKSFSSMTEILPFISLLVIFIPAGMTISKQYLIPKGLVQKYNKSIYIGALLSIVLNLILVPFCGLIGAVISVAVVEFSIMIIRFWNFYHLEGWLPNFRLIFKQILAAAIMGVIVYFVPGNYDIVHTLLQVLVGGFVYVLFIILLKGMPLNYSIGSLLKGFIKKVG